MDILLSYLHPYIDLPFPYDLHVSYVVHPVPYINNPVPYIDLHVPYIWQEIHSMQRRQTATTNLG